MRRALMLLVVLLASSLFGIQGSRAQFADCTDEYVRSFDVPADPHGAYPAWSAGRIQCREYFQVPINTPRGEIIVRAIGDANAADLLPPGGIEAIERGVERARDRMGGLGDYDLDDTTILISRPRSSAAEPQPRFGYSTAWTLPGVSRDGYAECHITLFIQTDYSAEEIQYAVAHELFHCIQKATLDAALIATTSGAGLWWGEGSAEWFAAWAVGPQSRWPRAAQFDAGVADGRALQEMSYRMAIFFYWLHETQGGATAMLPFLRAMSPGDDAAAQQRAMRDALSPEQWLAFAQAYDDRRIRYPGGALVPFGQRLEGETWRVDATSAHERELKAFVIGVGWTDYACGRWGNAVTEANVSVRPEREERWSSWPGELDTRASAGTGERYRMVGLVVDPGAEVRFTLEADRRESCTECLTRAVIDRCVVGRWRQTGGGPLEYLRSRGVPITMANQDPLVLTMRDDGTFSTNDITSNVEMETTDSHGHILRGAGSGQTSAVQGRWSAEEGVLMGCIDSGGTPEGVTVLEAEGHVRTSPWSGGVAGTSGSTTYTCSDTSFTTSSPTRYGPMTYTFTRETPPPRRR